MLLLAHPAAAEELGPILLSYRAEPGCPEVADFQRRVELRSSHVHFVDEGSHDRELLIRLSRQGEFTRGELRLIEKDGSLRQRSVRFTTCAEAVEGLALITAVSLDPHAQLQPEPPSTDEPLAEPAPPKRTPRTVPTPVQAPPRPTARAPVPNTGRGLELALGVEFATVFQLLPAAAFGASGFVDIGSSRQSWFAPLVRLTVSHLERRGIREPGFDANFALTLATLSVCPVKLDTGLFTLRPCGFASGGLLRGWGSNTSDARAGQSVFGAWGAAGALGLRLTPGVELALTLASAATLTRDAYVFQGAQVWSTPVLYLWGGLGFRFILQ